MMNPHASSVFPLSVHCTSKRYRSPSVRFWIFAVVITCPETVAEPETFAVPKLDPAEFFNVVAGLEIAVPQEVGTVIS
jgi:hypothetical protein